MNRGQRRKFVKEAKKKGVSRDAAKLYLAVKEAGINFTDNFPKEFNDGDEVKINVESLKKQSNYERKAQTYKEFLDEHKETVFKIGVSKGALCALEEHLDDGEVKRCPWMFYSGDLVRVERRDE